MPDEIKIESPDARFKRYQKSVSRKALWTDILDEAYKLYIPNRNDFFVPNRTPGEERTNRIFTSTPAAALIDYANNIVSNLMPPGRRWIKPKAGPKENEDFQQILDEDNETIFNFIWGSNFDVAIHEAILEMGVSTGVLLLNEGTQDEPLEFYAIPLNQVSFESGKRGQLESFWRLHELSIRQIMRNWPNAELTGELIRTLKTNPDQKTDCIEGTIFYPENPEGKQIFYYVQIIEGRKDIVTEFRDFNPWTAFRAMHLANEDFGRGPGFTALPTARELNQVKLQESRSRELLTNPIILSPSSSSFNPYTTNWTPGAIIALDPTLLQFSPPTTMNFGNQSSLRKADIAELQQEIRSIFLVDPFLEPQTPQQSATEASLKSNAWTTRNQAFIGRFGVEMQLPIYKKVVKILARRGLIKNWEEGGRKVSLEFISPLLDSQSQKDVQNLVQYSQVMTEMFQPNVEQSLMTMISDSTALPFVIAEKMGIDTALIKTKDQLDLIIAKAKAAAQQQQEEQQPPVNIPGLPQQGGAQGAPTPPVPQQQPQGAV